MISRFDFNNIDNQKRNNQNSNSSNKKKTNSKGNKQSQKTTADYKKSSKKITRPAEEKRQPAESSKNVKSFIKPRKNEFSFKIILVLIMVIGIVYLGICISKIVNSKNISTYQVKDGALTEQNSYKGLILREEEIYKSKASGYYNYYLKEGEKASHSDLVYTVDGSGKIKEMMSNQTGDASTLTKEDLDEIKSEIVKFSKEYDQNSFEDVYNFKEDLNDVSLKMSNLYILNQITNMSLNGTNVIKNYCCDGDINAKTGYVVYTYDNFEDVKPEDINSTYFKDKEEEKHIIANNEMIDVGDFAYKLITSNTWQLMFVLESEEKADEYNGKEVKVKFSKDQSVLKGKMTVLDAMSPEKNQSTEKIGMITFNSNVSDYLNNRYVDFEIMSNENNGYKIPVSAVAQKDFLLIPKEIGFDFNNVTNTVCIKTDVYLEDGSKSYVTQKLNVYDIDDTDYYVDTSIDAGISLGSVVYGEDNVNSYKINRSGTLLGVYKINQGYADFKKIKKLYENDEYCIIDPTTTTIKSFDYIALDASKIKDNEYIYE